MTNREAERTRSRLRRAALWMNLAVFVASIVAIVLSAGYFAHRPLLRARLDATKTRAYSLSEQTLRLLHRLQAAHGDSTRRGDWRISVILVEENVDRATLRQIDEVLSRYEAACNAISVERIDPTQPESLATYEDLTRRLRSIYADEIDRYESHIRQGRNRYDQLVRAAQDEAARLQILLQRLAADDRQRPRLQQIYNGFSLLSENSGTITRLLDESMAVNEAQPMPDYDKARDTLVAVLTEGAQYLANVAAMYEDFVRASGLAADVRASFAKARPRLSDLALELQGAADPLIQIQPLELSRVSRELATGEAAVITSPDRAAVIPAWQLLPRGNIRQTGEGVITFDQRFRGEQLLSSTIQAMIVRSMPMVVFVHAQHGSMLKHRPNGVDLVGLSSILKASRYDVREWSVISDPERPRPEANQAAVWIVCPPPFTERLARSAFEPPAEEKALVAAAKQLIDDGESVMLNYYPSTMHKYKAPDPWQGLMAPFGMDADTSRILFQEEYRADGEPMVRSAIEFVDLDSAHPVARATDGQLFMLAMPVPMTLGEVPQGVTRMVIAAAEPAANRWLEEDWTQGAERISKPERHQLLDGEVPFVIAASRTLDDGDRAEQRLIAVGSVKWMFSEIADRTIPIGGDRIALLFPGNIEFMQASVAWLSGMDAMIAPSPTSQHVARLTGINDQARRRWWWITLAIMPGGCLVLGIVVWFTRRV